MSENPVSENLLVLLVDDSQFQLPVLIISGPNTTILNIEKTLFNPTHQSQRSTLFSWFAIEVFCAKGFVQNTSVLILQSEIEYINLRRSIGTWLGTLYGWSSKSCRPLLFQLPSSTPVLMKTSSLLWGGDEEHDLTNAICTLVRGYRICNNIV